MLVDLEMTGGKRLTLGAGLTLGTITDVDMLGGANPDICSFLISALRIDLLCLNLPRKIIIIKVALGDTGN